MRARLPERQIDPKDGDAGGGESAGKRHQERRARIRPRAMRQHEAIRWRPVDRVKVAADSWRSGGIVDGCYNGHTLTLARKGREHYR
jgi:hypothetical protein